MKKYILLGMLAVVLAMPALVRATVSVEGSGGAAGQIQAKINDLLDQIERLKKQLQDLRQSGSGEDEPNRDMTPKPFDERGNACFGLSHNWKRGMEGDEVEKLQKFLQDEGHFPKGVKLTRFYGPLTAEAVAKFQVDEGVLPPTAVSTSASADVAANVSAQMPTVTTEAESGRGVVGPKTLERIKLLCARQYPVNPQPTSDSGYIRVTSPNGGENFSLGSNQVISWVSGAMPTAVPVPTTSNVEPASLANGFVNIGLISNEKYPDDSHCNVVASDYNCNKQYSVATRVVNQNKYNWKVAGIPEGDYRVKVCLYDQSYLDGAKKQCDVSDRSFSVSGTSSTGNNRTPVIRGITAPTRVDVDEEFTVHVRASDPENKLLRYSINWGDENPDVMSSRAVDEITQETSFTHSYSEPGNYKISVSVSDGDKSAKATVTVRVVSQ